MVLFEDEAAPAELKFASAWLDELRTSGEFTGKTDELAVLHQPHGFAAKRVAVVGGGKRDLRFAALRKAVAHRGPRTQAEGREDAWRGG